MVFWGSKNPPWHGDPLAHTRVQPLYTALVVGRVKAAERKETVVEELKKIRKVTPGLDKKDFSDQEVRAMSEMNADYVAHLLESKVRFSEES